MIAVIIVAIGTFIGMVCVPWYSQREYGFWDGDDVALGALTGLMLSLIPAVVTWPVLSAVAPRVNIEERLELVAMNDGREIQGGVHGNVFAVSGQIGEDMYYSYYFRVGPTSYRYAKVHHGSAMIFEDEQEKPYVRRTWSEIDPKWKKWTMDFQRGYFEEIHIPRGSIVNNYSLDLQ